MKKLFLSLVGLIFIGAALSSGAQAAPVAEELNLLLAPYRKSEGGLKSALKKTFYQEFRDKTEESRGEIFLLKGRLKIKISAPEEHRSLLVVNSKALWLETPFEEGFPVAVTKLSRKNVKKSEGIWNVFVGNRPLSDGFEVKKEKKKDSALYTLVPKEKVASEISKVEVEFRGDALLSLSYWDQMENKVSYIFEKWEKEKMTLSQFEYTPPKNSTVTNL